MSVPSRLPQGYIHKCLDDPPRVTFWTARYGLLLPSAPMGDDRRPIPRQSKRARVPEKGGSEHDRLRQESAAVYVRFERALLWLILAVGLARLVLSLAGLPNDVVSGSA